MVLCPVLTALGKPGNPPQWPLCPLLMGVGWCGLNMFQRQQSQLEGAQPALGAELGFLEVTLEDAGTDASEMDCAGSVYTK